MKGRHRRVRRFEPSDVVGAVAMVGAVVLIAAVVGLQIGMAVVP